MLRLGVMIWLLAATVLAGCFVTVVLLIPQLEAEAMRFIPWAAALAAVIAIIPAWVIAKSIIYKTQR